MKPVILALGGHDPCGAGIQADIQSILECGGQPVTLVSALTAQNGSGLRAAIPQQPEQLQLQAELLLDEHTVDAIKIGVIADHRLIPTITGIIGTARKQRQAPVVLDPVLECSGGGSFADAKLQSLMLGELLPLCTVLTPNREELLRLGKGDNTKDAAQALLNGGATAILASDAMPNQETICNLLYQKDGAVSEYRHPRLQGSFHGSGCTLASALATKLATTGCIKTAFNAACEYTEQAIKSAGATQ